MRSRQALAPEQGFGCPVVLHDGQHGYGQDDGQYDPADEEPGEDRRVKLQVHEVHRDQRELDHADEEQQESQERLQASIYTTATSSAVRTANVPPTFQ